MKFISIMCYDHHLKCNEEMLVCVDFIICVSRSCSDDKSLFYLNMTNQSGTSIQSIFMSAEDRDSEYRRVKEILMTDIQKENEGLKYAIELYSKLNEAKTK